MLALLRTRNFALVWVATLISTTGDWVLSVALPIYVFQLTGSALATSAMLVAEMLPALLLGSLAGVFVDRWDRRRTMIVCNLLLMLTLLPLLAVQSVSQVWIVYIVAAVQSILVQFFSPASNALLPSLVGEKDLVAANSLNSLQSNLARLVGPPVGGAVAALFGLKGVVLIDSSTFLVGAILIALIAVAARPEMPPASNQPDAVPAWKAVWREWLAGLKIIRRERPVAVLLTALGIASVGEGAFGVLFVIWVSRVLGGGSQELGWLMSAQAVGGLLGGLTIASLSKSLSPVQMAGLGAVIFGLLDIALFIYPLFFTGLWIGMVLLVLVGAPGIAAVAGANTLMQSHVHDEYRGRVFGALGTTMALLMLVGTLLAGTLGSAISPITLLSVLQGGTHILAGLLVLALLPLGYRQPLSTSVTPQAPATDGLEILS